MTGKRQVIAYVPERYVWISLILLPLVVIGLPYAFYSHFSDNRSLFSHWHFYLILLTVAGLPFAFRYCRMLLSGERGMVRLEDGQIVFVHPNQFAVRCVDVADIRFAFDGRGYPQAEFTLKNGNKSGFRLQGLDQEPEVIVARLRAVCGLAEDPDISRALAEMADAGSQQMIIARGSGLRTAAGLASLAALIGLAVWLGSGMSRLPMMPVLLAVAGGGILLSSWLAIRALLHSVCSIWISKGILYLNWRDQVSLNDVQDIALSSADAPWYLPAGAAERIAVRLRDGRTIYSAPGETFSEAAPVVLARLRAACGLPKIRTHGSRGRDGDHLHLM